MALIGTAVVFTGPKRERKSVSQSDNRMRITAMAASVRSRVFAVVGRKEIERWARALRLRTERA
jgi:precorrin-6x reductase